MDMSILVDEKLKTSGGEVTAFDAVAAENQSDVHKDVSEEAIAVTGKVKWFDAVKGYGFLIPEQEDGANIINQDILIHFSVLCLPTGHPGDSDMTRFTTAPLAVGAPFVGPSPGGLTVLAGPAFRKGSTGRKGPIT